MASPLDPGGMSPQLAGLTWLAGRWLEGSADHGTQETWTQTPDGRLTGAGVVFREGSPLFTEQLHIELHEGGLDYVALPQGAEQPTRFRLVEQSPTRLVFENPEHDWPTRIVYELEDNGSLTTQAQGPGRILEAKLWRQGAP